MADLSSSAFLHTEAVCMGLYNQPLKSTEKCLYCSITKCKDDNCTLNNAKKQQKKQEKGLQLNYDWRVRGWLNNDNYMVCGAAKFSFISQQCRSGENENQITDHSGN